MDNKKKEMNIDVPDIDFEKIDSIVNKGVKSKISFIRYLINCFKELGFRNIFHDKTELVIIFLICILTLLPFMINLNNLNIQGLYQFTLDRKSVV